MFLTLHADTAGGVVQREQRVAVDPAAAPRRAALALDA